MASATTKSLVLVQLSVLLLSFFTVLAADKVDGVGWTQTPHGLPTLPPVEAPTPHHHHHHHHKHAPAPAPVKTPTHPPVLPPVHPPAHPPTKTPSAHPPTKPPSSPVLRKLFAVQGVVYCKSCKYPGIDTLMGAKPLVGAVVKVQCNNTKYRPIEAKGTTDKNGYFIIMPKNVTTAGSHKCKVFLVSSPLATCDIPTNLHSGSTGAILIPRRKPPVATPPEPKIEIFTVGPFAFQPSKTVPCPR